MLEKILRWKPLWVFIFPTLLVLSSLIPIIPEIHQADNFLWVILLFCVPEAIFLLISIPGFIIGMFPNNINQNLSSGPVGTILMLLVTLGSIFLWVAYSWFVGKIETRKNIWLYVMFFAIFAIVIILFLAARTSFNEFGRSLP